MISVACVWVKGNVPYTADYVTRLYSMVARHLDRDFQFLCMTDRPTELGQALARLPPAKRFETCAITVIPPPPPGLAGWWSKLELFNPAHARALGSTVLYLDLDVLVVADLAPLIDFRVDGCLSNFALAPPGGNFRPLGYHTVRRYNSSVMLFTPGPRLASLYEDFRPEHARPSDATALPLWGDQDWIGERIIDADVMPAEWFPRLSHLDKEQEAPLVEAARAGARVILVKKPKPHVAAEKWPWFQEAWR